MSEKMIQTIEKCAECNKYPVFNWGGCWTEVFECDCVREDGTRMTHRKHAGRDEADYIYVRSDDPDWAQPRTMNAQNKSMFFS